MAVPSPQGAMCPAAGEGAASVQGVAVLDHDEVEVDSEDLASRGQVGEVAPRGVPGGDDPGGEGVELIVEVAQHLAFIAGVELIEAPGGQADRPDGNRKRIDVAVGGVDLDVESVGGEGERPHALLRNLISG